MFNTNIHWKGSLENTFKYFSYNNDRSIVETLAGVGGSPMKAKFLKYHGDGQKLSLLFLTISFKEFPVTWKLTGQREIKILW